MSRIETSPKIIGIANRISDGPTGPAIMRFMPDFCLDELAEGEDVNKTWIMMIVKLLSEGREELE